MGLHAFHDVEGGNNYSLGSVSLIQSSYQVIIYLLFWTICEMASLRGENGHNKKVINIHGGLGEWNFDCLH